MMVGEENQIVAFGPEEAEQIVAHAPQQVEHLAAREPEPTYWGNWLPWDPDADAYENAMVAFLLGRGRSHGTSHMRGRGTGHSDALAHGRGFGGASACGLGQEIGRGVGAGDVIAYGVALGPEGAGACGHMGVGMRLTMPVVRPVAAVLAVGVDVDEINY